MSDYGSIITTAGAAAEAAANASGTALKLTEFVVGDGGGAATLPDAGQTGLVNEVYRGSISGLSVNPDDVTQLIASLVIPRESGGYVVRELGILTEDGTLYSVSNYPDQTKPAPDSGLAVSMKFDYMLAVSSAANITFVLPAGEYLTEVAADALYLRQDKYLGEIQDAGSDAQQAASDNINALSKSGGTLTGPLAMDGQDIALDREDPTSVPDGDFVTTPLARFRLKGRGGNTDPEGAYAHIYYEEHVGVDNALCVSIDGFGTSSMLRFVNDADGGAVNLSGALSAALLYEAGQRVYSPNNPQPLPQIVTDVQLGARVLVSGIGDVFQTPTGCVMTSLAGDSDNDIAGYYAPVQKLINGTWITISG